MGLVTPLLPVMLLAILLGTLGLSVRHLSHHPGRIWAVAHPAGGRRRGAEPGDSGASPGDGAGDTFWSSSLSWRWPGACSTTGSSTANHFIAFKLLAIIRHKVFAALRRLCPARLEGRDKGNLISVITSDIELLEVFYAHTISPIAIAVATSLVMVLFIRAVFPGGGGAGAGRLHRGGSCAPPGVFGKRGGRAGMEFRSAFGDLNSFIPGLPAGAGRDHPVRPGREEKKADGRAVRQPGRSAEKSEPPGGVPKVGHQPGHPPSFLLPCSFS